MTTTQKTSAIDTAFRALESLLALLLVAMVVLVFGNVVLRYGFRSGILISEELSRFLLVWLVLLGAIVATREGAHLGSDTLLVRLGPLSQRACAAASQALIIISCGVLLVGLWRQHDLYAGTIAPVSGVSMIWVYGIGYVAGVGMAVISAWRLWRIVTNRASRVDLGLTTAEEPL